MKTNCCDLLSHCWCIFNKSSALFSFLPPHILQQMQTGTKLIIIHMHDIFRKRLHYGINFYATVAPQPFKTSCVASQMKKKKTCWLDRSTRIIKTSKGMTWAPLSSGPGVLDSTASHAPIRKISTSPEDGQMEYAGWVLAHSKQMSV